MRMRLWIGLLVLVVGWAGTGAPRAAHAQEAETDPPEVALGERLFLETRFAEFFARRSGGDVNAVLSAGDPVVDTTETTGAPLPGPFAGQSINCRACHLVDEQRDAPGGGMRTYADFARRSPIPARADGLATTARNAPALVDSALPREGGVLLHFDGEFASLEDLVRGTLTGRNYGWLPGEQSEAIDQIAAVLRGDDGTGELAQEFGGAYARVLGGTDPTLPAELRLPAEYRVDVASASDRQLVDAVAALIAVYVRQLVFSQDADGAFDGTPYDRFLVSNHLPRRPRKNESPVDYARRLRRALKRLEHPRFVDEGAFALHDQAFAFGPDALRGLRIFLAEPAAGRAQGRRSRGRPGPGTGNCVACHPPPAFTDFSFHDTGVTQREYDAVHGSGAFAGLAIPTLRQRERSPERYLPATAAHPRAEEPFRRPASAADPRFADLGVWNVFANPDFPAPQDKLWQRLCEREGEGAPEPLRRSFPGLLAFSFGRCTPDTLLRSAIAVFKTPGLRDLGDSNPYMHDGAFDSLSAVIGFYRGASQLARDGRLRNGDPAIAGIDLDDTDAADLVSFLRALNEDYE